MFNLSGFVVRKLCQALQWCLHVRMFVTLDDLALGAGDLGSEQARGVQIEPGIEGFLIKGLGILLRNMGVALVLPSHAGILAVSQGVVVAVTRARLSLLDAQFVQVRDRQRGQAHIARVGTIPAGVPQVSQQHSLSRLLRLG